MKTKFGSIIVAGSGKIGGHVASRNRSGSYLRTKVTPVNPNTSFQSAVRALLTALSQSWKSLSDIQRQAWNNAVASFARTDIFGDLKNPTGFNLYQRLNNNLAQIGVAAISVPPLPSDVPSVLIGAVTANDSGVVTVATAGAVPAGTAMLVWCTAGVSAGVSFVKSEYRSLKSFAAAAASPHAVSAEYQARFGVPAAGTRVFAKIEFVNIVTGQKSQSQSASVISLAD
jgi:hypothetical protein